MMDFKGLIKDTLLLTSSVLYHNHKSKILYYHDIYRDKSYRSLDSDILMGTSLEMFKRHLDVIKREGYSIVPRITRSEGEVAIMLDDGFRGIWDNRQFFYDNNICPTVFLAADLIGREGFLTKDEILELQSHGFIFESHGWWHRDLTSLDDDELDKELYGSEEYLSEMLGKTVSEICLPLGFYSDHLIEMIKKAGYAAAYSSVGGNFCDSVSGWLRTRNLLQFATPFELRMILRGGNELTKKHYLKMYHKKQVL